jgi:hypothetical protein
MGVVDLARAEADDGDCVPPFAVVENVAEEEAPKGLAEEEDP